MSTINEVTLVSEDGIKFQVRIQVVRCIGLFKNLLELHINGGVLPPLQVPNVNSLILDKIIEYLNNFTASRENSALSRPPRISNGRSVTISGIQSLMSNNNNEGVTNGDDDDEDEDDDGDFSVPGITKNEISLSPVKEETQQVTDEFQFASSDEEEDDENIFDFLNFDEQSLKLFTPYEQNFFGALDIPTLIEITKAANFMHIPHLLDSCCKAIANHMKGLSVEDLRSKFNIKNDFTPEEEERVRRETSWIDE